MLEHDQRPYRAAQIRKWIFEKRAGSWEQMTDLPRELREQLAADFNIWSAEIAIHRKDDDGTEKLLLTLADGRQGVRLAGENDPSPKRKRGIESPSSLALRASMTPAENVTEAPVQIECVLLRDDKDHCSLCISTQVGCAMKCASAPLAWAA